MSSRLLGRAKSGAEAGEASGAEVCSQRCTRFGLGDCRCSSRSFRFLDGWILLALSSFSNVIDSPERLLGVFV